MAGKSLLIQYEYCTGCYACEVACKQEHHYTGGKVGIKVNEMVTEMPDRVHIDYIPFLTRYCNLCAERTKRGEQPACVKHCQATCIEYGTTTQLAKAMETKSRSVIFSPK